MAVSFSGKKYDFVITGNGCLGLGLAYRLMKKDPKVKLAVVGPSSREGSATLAAGAMINCWAEIARGQFDNPAMADRAQITIDAMPLWDRLCSELSGDSGQNLEVQWGTYVINNALGSPHEWAVVDYIIQEMKKRNIPHELLSPKDVSWLKPDARAQVTRIVSIPDGRIRTGPVLGAYETALRKMGATLIDAKVSNISASTGKFLRRDEVSVTIDNGDVLKTGDVVLANGTFAQALVDQLPELRATVPRLLWGAGSALDITLPDWVRRYGGVEPSILEIDKVVRSVDRGGACGLHVVPYGEGSYYCGASSGVWFESEPKARVHGLHVLIRSLPEEINKGFFFAGAAIRGPGFRPVSIDSFPLLGESSIKGVWFANGMKRDGFTCSPLIANELATALLGGTSRLPSRFSPSRKLISYKTKSKAIEDFADGDIGGEYQHGLTLPPYAVENYRKFKMDTARRVYEKRNIEDFGIHPEMVHLYENDEFFAAVDHPRESVVENA